jgi:hypothetical protein
MAMTIFADNTVDFEDPKTWATWELTPFVLEIPWKVATSTCD